MKRSKQKAGAVKSVAPPPPPQEKPAPAPVEEVPRSIATTLIGSAFFFVAALSSLVGFDTFSMQSHIVAFSISLVVALLLGLSPGARDFFDRWTLKDSQRKVDYKKAVIGMLLVLVPVSAGFGWTGPSGSVTVASLAFSVTCFS